MYIKIALIIFRAIRIIMSVLGLNIKFVNPILVERCSKIVLSAENQL